MVVIQGPAMSQGKGAGDDRSVGDWEREMCGSQKAPTAGRWF
jgi:hypothetical protein